MQSTVNYLWHTDDLLGQGATASVYKARNKVGHSPAQAPQAWKVLGPLSPWWAARVVCGEAEAHSGVREMLRLWEEVWGAVKGSLGCCVCQAQFGAGEREREEDTKPSTWDEQIYE